MKMDLVLITYNDWCAIKPNQNKTKQISLVVAQAQKYGAELGENQT